AVPSRILDGLIFLLPKQIVRAILEVAALAPPILKSAFFKRIFSRTASHSIRLKTELVRTNLGISSAIRCRVPLRKTDYAFGRPNLIVSERATLALVEELLSDCRHFVDVGAHEGIFTFLAAHRHLEHIHWFEPDPELYARLSENLKCNGILTSGNRAAVSAASGTAVFLRNLSDDASGSLTQEFTSRHTTVTEEVKTVSLDDYFHGRQIANALVKIDVEGAGSAVWSGAKEIGGKI